jgi:ribose/xylose/arabinose/galactoside ABC-type transport system permease subunit
VKKQDLSVVVLMFLGAFFAVIAAGGDEHVPALVKLLAAASAGGCGAVLGVLRPVGTSIRPTEQVEREAGDRQAREAGDQRG